MTAAPSRFHAVLHLVALGILVLLTTLQVPLTQPLIDAFQEGEYATFGYLAQTQPDFERPVLIHGGLDVVPSRVAAVVCQADHQVVCVRALNTILRLASVGLFVSILAVLVGLGTAAAVMAGLPAAAMLWLYNGPILNIVDAHQGTPGVRDLFMLAGLLLAALLCNRLDRGKAVAILLATLGGLTGVGLFWAYNRGLVLGAAAVLVAGGVCLERRSFWPVLFVGLGGLAGLAAIVLMGGVELLKATAFDIRYWGENGAMWQSPLQLLGAIALFVLTLLVLTGAIPLAVRLRAERPGKALMLVVLCAVYVLYVVQTLNRPDIIHLRWVVWPAVLILAILIKASLDGAAPVPNRSSARLALLLLASGAALETFSDRSIVRTVLGGLTDNIVATQSDLPTDRALAGEDLARTADQVAARGGCTFAANNAAIIYLLARVPPCSRFALGAYVAADREKEVIAALDARRPAIILWDSSAWYSRIDGRALRDHTPELAAWIEVHYPIEIRVGEQVLRAREKLDLRP